MLLLLWGSLNLVVIGVKHWTILEPLPRNKQRWVFCWTLLNAKSISALYCWNRGMTENMNKTNAMVPSA